MEKIRSCPECGSTKITTEKRIDGDSSCGDCKHKDKTGNFIFGLPTFKQYLKMNGKEAVLKEDKQDTKGIYVAVKYNQSASDDLLDFIKKYNIPSTLKAEDFHTTLIYSRKYADISTNEGEDLGSAEPLKFHIFETQEDKRALVILLKSEYLENRHKDLMKEHNLTYDFKEYLPHITLSYDIGDYDISKLDIKDLPKHLTINTEYKEDLDLNKSYTDVSDKDTTN